MQSVIYYQMHPFKTSVLYSMFFFLVAQCLSNISMVGLHIITFSLKWVMLKPVMLPVPLYWLQSDRATQQLLSQYYKYCGFRKFILWKCFCYCLFLLCCGLNDCNRNLARQKKTNNDSYHNVIQSDLRGYIIDERNFCVWKGILFWILSFSSRHLSRVIWKIGVMLNVLI